MHNDKRTDAPGIREIWNEFPPQDLDAERAVLGSMLLSPRAAITDVADLVQPGDFYSDAHVRIAKVIFELAETTIGGIDAVTVGSELAKRGELEQVGHAPYLENLLATVGHASHARYYADTVREMADRRRAIQEHKAAIAQALDCTKPFATNGRSRIAAVTTCMADVDPRPVTWLWPGRIAAGRLNLLVGKPGEGKSFLTIDLAARVSTGTPWPDGSACLQGSVILISAEDDPHDTIRPRLDAHHADVSKVHLLSAVRRRTAEGDLRETVFTLADVAALETTLISMPDNRLIIIDPIGSYLGGGTDAHRDNEVRGVLAPVAQLAERFGVAVLVVAHRRKGTGGSADDSALGSRAFTGIARAVWHLSRDSQSPSRRLLLPGKINVGPEGVGGLAFTIVPDPGRIVWEREPVQMTADDALAAETGEADRGSALDEATEWLKNALADGARPGKELKTAADSDGISERTLERAKKRLGVITAPDGFRGPWSWRLPRVRQDSAQSAKDETLADCGDSVADSGGDWGERYFEDDQKTDPAKE